MVHARIVWASAVVGAGLSAVACLSSSPAPVVGSGGFDGGSFDGGAGAFDAISPAEAATPDSSPAADTGFATSAFDAAAPPLTSLAAGNVTSPQHIAIDPATGNLYVASFAGSYVVLSPTGLVLGTYGNTGATALKQAVGIARDAKGNVFVGDYGANAVLEFDPTGAYVATFDGAKSNVTLGRITGVAIDPSGDIAAADDDNGRVVVFDTTGAVLRQLTTTLDGGGPTGTTSLVFAGTDLWVTKYYDHTVAKLDSTGAIVATYGTGGPGTLGTFAQPYAIASASNVLYIADNGANTVQALTTSGTFEWVIATDGDGGTVNATGVATSPDNSRLYVSDGIGNRILVYAL